LGKDFFDNSSYPKVDVKGNENQLIIEAEVPGLKRDQISVEVDGNILRIKGEKKIKDEHKSQSYIHRELKHSSFCRSFKLPENVNVDKIESSFQDGVLEITIPKNVIDPPTTQVKNSDQISIYVVTYGPGEIRGFFTYFNYL
jgi:HSP20 family protein